VRPLPPLEAREEEGGGSRVSRHRPRSGRRRRLSLLTHSLTLVRKRAHEVGERGPAAACRKQLLRQQNFFLIGAIDC
jgi:hypothetical protein